MRGVLLTNNGKHDNGVPSVNFSILIDYNIICPWTEDFIIASSLRIHSHQYRMIV